MADIGGGFSCSAGRGWRYGYCAAAAAGSPLDRAQLMLGGLRTELEDELGHSVDLADLCGAATTLAIEGIHTGRRVLTCDHYAADTFEMLTLPPIRG